MSYIILCKIMDNFLKIKVFLYYQFLIIEKYLYLWKNGTSKIDERLYYNELNFRISGS